MDAITIVTATGLSGRDRIVAAAFPRPGLSADGRRRASAPRRARRARRPVRYSDDPREDTLTETPIDSAYADRAQLEACASQIAEAGRELGALGWTPATSSNFSMRLDAGHAAVTISGRDKGRLGVDDIMVVDLQGRAVGTDTRPSAETALHTQVYRRYAEAGAVLHTHSRAQSVASRLFASRGRVRFEGWELQKAISGYTTHDSVLDLPVFPNTQDMDELVHQVDAWLDAGNSLHGYLIDGHGIYTWGRDMAQTRRHLEAFEFLLNCELDLLRLKGTLA